MQRKILLNLLVVSICGIILSTVVFFVIQTITAQRSADGMSESRLADVERRMRSNDQRLKELADITKEDNLSRARALAMLIELEPDFINDFAKLVEIKAALDVDEIHILMKMAFCVGALNPLNMAWIFRSGSKPVRFWLFWTIPL